MEQYRHRHQSCIRLFSVPYIFVPLLPLFFLYLFLPCILIIIWKMLVVKVPFVSIKELMCVMYLHSDPYPVHVLLLMLLQFFDPSLRSCVDEACVFVRKTGLIGHFVKSWTIKTKLDIHRLLMENSCRWLEHSVRKMLMVYNTQSIGFGLLGTVKVLNSSF